MFRKFSLSIICLFFFAGISFAEIISLKSGKTVEGKIIEETDKYIKLDFEGVLLTYFLDEIVAIDGKSVTVVQSTSLSVDKSNKLDPQDIFKNIGPAVVYIETKGSFKKIVKDLFGSGFIIDASGVIVTNYHVISAAQEIKVKLKDGTVYAVTDVIYHDVSRDFCLLKIDAQNLPQVSLGDSNALQVGEKVYCVGNPLGLEYSFSDGMISGIRDENGLKWIQFTAPVSPGNSGGPILDSRGEVMGIATSVRQDGQNINFALAINEIKPFITTGTKISLKEFVQNAARGADYYFTQGSNAYLQGDLDKAISYFTQGLEINPANANAYVSRGYLYGLIKKYDQEISDFNKALQIDSGLARGYVMRGARYFLLKENDLAINDFTRALEIDPSLKERVYTARAFAYAAKKDFQHAIVDFNKAVEMNPSSESVYIDRGSFLAMMGDFNKALADYAKAMQINSNAGKAYAGRALIYASRGEYDKALADQNRAIQIDPNDGETYDNRAAVYARKGEYDKAWEDVLKAEASGYRVDPAFVADLKKYSGRE
ncbi:MAG: tetratricopeptide repeat protein [Candidatus Omnitrophica bacterium]|nr:tetratricopeptide repeat protein [Candidatus Omnitrophota bacterium]